MNQPSTPTPSVAYEVLDQTHPEYSAALWEKLDELYEGGFRVVENAQKYLPQYAGEHISRYKERIGAASYVNYLGAICDQYIGQLFAQELVVAPAADKKEEGTTGEAPEPDGFWQEFAADADLKGTDFVAVMKEAFTSALLKRRGLIGCDFPRVEGDDSPKNRAEEDAQGRARGYAFTIDVAELLDWEYSSRVQRVARLAGGAEVRWTIGKLKFAVLKTSISQRGTLSESRGTIVEEFKVWRLDENGFAAWDLYRTAPRKADEAASKQQGVPLVDSGTTAFTEIPIIELSMPKPLWLGNKLGPMSIEHFQGRSALNSAVNRSLFALLFIKLGSEIKGVGEALPAERQQNPNRGDEVAQKYREAGAHVLGEDDDAAYVEPEGKAYRLRAELLKDLVDEMYRISHQMASSLTSTSKAVGRSGDSKAQDWRATEIVLGAFGALVRDLAKRVYDVIAEARKDDVVWVVHGLDHFGQDDRETLIKEAAQAKLVAIPSRTFNVEYSFRLAMALLGNIPPETQETIKDEIAKGVVAEEAMASMMREALAAGGANGAGSDDGQQDTGQQDTGTQAGGSSGDGAFEA